MNWRAWWDRLSGRERTLIGAAAAVFALALVRYLIVSPFLSYRESLRDEIASHHEMLENDHAYLARAADVTRQLESLRVRYREIRGQLVPGDTPTLAAASLQDTLHQLASEKGINIQSTQVMREETIGDFRRIAVRLTVTGELRQLAEFLAGIETGARRFSVAFFEISRRGAVLRGQSARALAATVEVNAFLQGTDKGGAAVESAQASPPPEGAPAEPAASAAVPLSPGAPTAAESAAPGSSPGPVPSAPSAARPAVKILAAECGALFEDDA
jgi:Tfp pilus assembly protein PilO